MNQFFFDKIRRHQASQNLLIYLLKALETGDQSLGDNFMMQIRSPARKGKWWALTITNIHRINGLIWSNKLFGICHSTRIKEFKRTRKALCQPLLKQLIKTVRLRFFFFFLASLLQLSLLLPLFFLQLYDSLPILHLTSYVPCIRLSHHSENDMYHVWKNLLLILAGIETNRPLNFLFVNMVVVNANDKNSRFLSFILFTFLLTFPVSETYFPIRKL